MFTRVVGTVIVVAAILAALVAATRSTVAQPNGTSEAVSQDGTAQPSAAEHGEYIVHHVAMCIYCHTPRSKNAALDLEQLLQGAPVPVESPFDGKRWAFQAPKLAGLPGGWNEEQLVRFLQTGETITGRTPLPPMPPFRMTQRDAAAVVTYLKSLQ